MVNTTEKKKKKKKKKKKRNQGVIGSLYSRSCSKNSNIHVLTSLEISENQTFFWCLQGKSKPYIFKFSGHKGEYTDLLGQIYYYLTLSWRRPISYRNWSIDLQSKSMDWFLYDIGLRHERDKWSNDSSNKLDSTTFIWYLSACWET